MEGTQAQVSGGDVVTRLWRDTLILAPMVRAGTLPLRLLSLAYGADCVYGEEIIDRKVLRTVRVTNDVLGTIDFVDAQEVVSKKPKAKRKRATHLKGSCFSSQDRAVVYRTCTAEKGRNVFQMGTANAVLAVQAASILHKDIAALDINMGCPKPFSVKGGMGAALLRTPELAADILSALRRNHAHLPVSTKIRLLSPFGEDVHAGGDVGSAQVQRVVGVESEQRMTQRTIEFALRMARAGAQAIAVHGRTNGERPSHPPHMHLLRHIRDALRPMNVPMLANGDIFMPEDFVRIKSITGCDGLMVARAAMWNPSIFAAGKIAMKKSTPAQGVSLVHDVGSSNVVQTWSDLEQKNAAAAIAATATTAATAAVVTITTVQSAVEAATNKSKKKRKKKNRKKTEVSTSRGLYNPPIYSFHRSTSVNKDKAKDGDGGLDAATGESAAPLPEGLIDLREVIRAYLRRAADCANSFNNTKYVVMQMLSGAKVLGDNDPGRLSTNAKSNAQLAAIFSNSCVSARATTDDVGKFLQTPDIYTVCVLFYLSSFSLFYFSFSLIIIIYMVDEESGDIVEYMANTEAKYHAKLQALTENAGDSSKVDKESLITLEPAPNHTYSEAYFRSTKRNTESAKDNTQTGAHVKQREVTGIETSASKRIKTE